MDIIKEIRDVKDAIEAALEDGRIRPLEAIRIIKELADLLAYLGPVVFGQARDAEASETNKQG